MRFNLLTFMSCLVIISGCNFRSDGKSNEDRKRECAEECAKMTSMPFLQLFLLDYDSAAVDTIVVKEITAGKKDTLSYSIVAKYSTDFFGTPRKKVWIPSWILEKAIPLKDEYLIIIPGEQVHLLRNIKMGPIPQCNMFDCDFVPGIRGFELDGVVCDDDVNDGGNCTQIYIDR